MTTSLLLQRASDGSDLQAVLSLAAIKSLSPAQVTALNNIGIQRVSDLLQFKPVHDARLVVLAARGQIAHDLSLADLLSTAGAALKLRDLADAPTASLASVSQAISSTLLKEFAVQTVAQLAQFGPFLEAQRFLTPSSEVFREPDSAPEELMPQMIGSVESTAVYSTFVKENTLRIDGLALVYDREREHYVDLRLAALFPISGQRPIRMTFLRSSLPPLPDPQVTLHLGFVSKSTQRWVNTGVSLGEIVFSLALAPGESRNIAILDWTRAQRTKRSEDTTAREELTNNLFHTRALDECTTVTAGEHQNGGTLLAAGTLATAAAGVASAAMAGGLAGALPGATIGAIAGAVLGSPTGPGDLATTLAGAGAGAVIGFGIGAAGATGSALLGAANAQLGVLRTDSSGNREVTTDVHQTIAERISQNASSIRSLRSNVFVSDDQTESQNLTGRNLTNYNHSHMLNLQYYEVLQRYRAELRLTAAEPLLFLPFRPLDFDLEMIADFWSILRTGVSDLELRKNFDRLIRFGQPEAEKADSEALSEARLILTRGPAIGIGLPSTQTLLTPSASLLVRDEDSRSLSQLVAIPGLTTVFSLKANEKSILFSSVAGIQVENLGSNEEVHFDLSLRLKDNAVGSSRTLSLRRVERRARPDGTFIIELGQGVEKQSDEPSLEELGELERYFDSRRYFFTRLLLLSIEKEQIIDLVEALMFQSEAVNGLATFQPFDQPGSRDPRFTPRQALPELVVQDWRADLVDALTAGLKNPAGRPALTNAQVQQVAQSVISRVRTLLASADGQAKTSAELTNQVQKETQVILLKARLPKATAASISQQAAASFRKRFDGLKTIPGITTPAIHLDEFIEPEPLAITGNTLVFRMKKNQNSAIQQNPLARQHLSAVLNHPAAIDGFVAVKKLEVTSQDVFLPTSGVFAEAILGRSNASEKVDATRFINWQDLPIPNAAPRIADLQLQNLRSEPLDTTATVPNSVLNIVNPPAFPDTTARDALNVLNNGNLFRDMSRSDVLAGVLNNLSSLANNQSQLAGNLAGQAQQEALRQAASIANKVADLTAQFAQSTPPPPTTDTAKAGLLNQVLKLLGDAGAGQGVLPGTGAVPGSAPGPVGNGGSGGIPAGNSGAAPNNSSSTPAANALEEVKQALGVSTESAPASQPPDAAQSEKVEITFLANLEDISRKQMNLQFITINAQVGGVSETTGLTPANIPVPMNVTDEAGNLRVITPNMSALIKLPKNGQGKVILTAPVNDLVSLIGQAPLRLGINQDRFVVLQVRIASEKVAVDAADAAEAIRKVLAMAEPADGSASPLKLGAAAKDVKSFFKVEAGAAAGKFTVLVPDGALDIKQLDR